MIEKYETLYSRDSKGNVRIWYQERDGNKIRTISGLQDGKQVTSEWSVATPKNVGKSNATTGESQADSEIKNKYKIQLETGYTKNIKNIDTAIKYIEPMLAAKYKDRVKKINFATQNWAIQCKFNGNRCIATKYGLTTRKGKTYVSVPHINKALEKFFIKYPNAVLDGELYNYDLRQSLNELNSLVRKPVNATTDDLKRSEEVVRFYVYDGWGWDDTNDDTPYSERKEWIDKNLVGKVNYIEKVDTHKISSVEEMEKYYYEYLNDGEEGGILRDLDSGYEIGKRSKNLLKVKSEDDDEATIVDINPGKNSSVIATLKWKNKQFDGMFKGKTEIRMNILKNKKDWIGKDVTFLYMGLTGLGTPNFARIDPANCFKGDR